MGSSSRNILSLSMGEQKHLRKHAGLALSMGMDPKNILIADNGVEVSLSEKEFRVSGNVPVRPCVC